MTHGFFRHKFIANIVLNASIFRILFLFALLPHTNWFIPFFFCLNNCVHQNCHLPIFLFVLGKSYGSSQYILEDLQQISNRLLLGGILTVPSLFCNTSFQQFAQYFTGKMLAKVNTFASSCTARSSKSASKLCADLVRIDWRSIRIIQKM